MSQINNLPKLLLIDKPKHWTSADVVRKLKSRYKIKKIGHAGTLDPLATGLLIVGLNEGTKLLTNLIGSDKTYKAIIHFNYQTTTLDNEGEIINYKYKMIMIEEIEKALHFFKTTDYYQIPPLYSAIKLNGIKCYNLARNNKTAELQPRLVKLKDYKIISYANNQLIVFLNVSKGFYIRSFALDLGLKLNNYGNLAELRRISVGNYNVENSYKLSELDDILN